MSITLTNRDTATLVLSQGAATSEGINLVAAGQTLADRISGLFRFTPGKSVGSATRVNVRLERRVRDVNGKIWVYAVDKTVSIPVGGPLVVDDVDDLITWSDNYTTGATETVVGDMLNGVARI